MEMDCQFISIYGKFVTSQTAGFSRAGTIPMKSGKPATHIPQNLKNMLFIASQQLFYIFTSKHLPVELFHEKANSLTSFVRCIYYSVQFQQSETLNYLLSDKNKFYKYKLILSIMSSSISLNIHIIYSEFISQSSNYTVRDIYDIILYHDSIVS